MERGQVMGAVVEQQAIVAHVQDPQYAHLVAEQSVGAVIAAAEAGARARGMVETASRIFAGAGIVARMLRGITPQMGCTADERGYRL